MLRVADLRVSYGNIRAVHGVSFDVPDGSIVALLGPNGAGKTTTLRAISGLVRAQSGAIEWDGRRVDGLTATQIARLGLAHVPEGRGMLPELTVLENLRLATFAAPREGYSFAEELERAFALFPVLAERRRQAAGSLSGGEQQMLAIARALVTRPKLLMVDELSLGLAPTVVDRLFEALREVNERGCSVLLVEQYIDRALELTDTAVILNQGVVRVAGGAAALLEDASAVRESYFGADSEGAMRRRERPAFPVRASLQVELPDRLLSRLERGAARAGSTLDDVVAEALKQYAANGARTSRGRKR